MNPGSFACVIFDCDGTLVDSETLCSVVLAKEMRRFHLDLDAAELVRRYRGWPLANILSDLSARHTVTLDEEFSTRFRALELEAFESELQVIPGIPEALRSVSVAKCVASSGPVSKIKRALKVTGLDVFFGSHIFSAHDVDSWKPEPHLFLHAAARMQVDPRLCAVVEDSDVGILAARRANMSAFLYDPEQLGSAHAGVTTFQRMSALPSLLAAHAPR